MSKKDYEAVASAIAATEAQGLIGTGARSALAGRLADIFKRDNEAFDRERFLAACKGNGQVRA